MIFKRQISREVDGPKFAQLDSQKRDLFNRYLEFRDQRVSNTPFCSLLSFSAVHALLMHIIYQGKLHGNFYKIIGNTDNVTPAQREDKSKQGLVFDNVCLSSSTIFLVCRVTCIVIHTQPTSTTLCQFPEDLLS